MKKKSLITLVTCCAVVLSGCSTQNQVTQLDLNQESITEKKPNALDQQSKTSEKLTQPPKGTGMKTLTDFKQIEASQATITTNKGQITFELYQEKTPITVANFLNLAESGYYDGIKFHRIIEDFMAQVGDPLTKDDSKKPLWGTGGPGYTIPDEFDPSLRHDSEGIVSMANAGPNTGGSQIFITYGPQPHLDSKHTVFGKVISGLEVLRELEVGDQILSVTYK